MLARKTVRFFRRLQNENCIEWLRINRSTCLAVTPTMEKKCHSILANGASHKSSIHSKVFTLFDGWQHTRRVTWWAVNDQELLMLMSHNFIWHINEPMPWLLEHCYSCLLRFSYFSAAHILARRFVNNVRKKVPEVKRPRKHHHSRTDQSLRGSCSYVNHVVRDKYLKHVVAGSHRIRNLSEQKVPEFELWLNDAVRPKRATKEEKNAKRNFAGKTFVEVCKQYLFMFRI